MVVTDGIWSIWCEGVIVASWIAEIDLLDFEVAAWFEVSEVELVR